MKKINRIEVSDSGTIIVSARTCPLSDEDVITGQVFNEIVCCSIRGQQKKDFTCPKFYGVIYCDVWKFQVDCR